MIPFRFRNREDSHLVWDDRVGVLLISLEAVGWGSSGLLEGIKLTEGVNLSPVDDRE